MVTMTQDTRTIYEARDRAASNSYTLHRIPENPPAHIGESKQVFDCYALRSMFLGNVTFVRSKSGMRTTCYLHLFGAPIVKGIANGCGYDVQSAAFIAAWVKYMKGCVSERVGDDVTDGIAEAVHSCDDEGRRWKDALETKAGICAAHIGG